MGLFSFKSFILGFIFINMIMGNDYVDAQTKQYLEPGVIDRCTGSGNTLPGCHPDKKQIRQEANLYQRGCSVHTRCRNK